MADVTSGCVFTPTHPEMNYRKIVVYTANTADNSDTFTLTLADYGIGPAGLLYADGWVQTTEGSVVVAEAVTTAVVSGVLTVTLGAVGGANKVRVVEIVGKPA